MTFNEITDEYTVTHTINHVDEDIIHLWIDGELIETTAEHPFYTSDGIWIDAADLQPGAMILSLDGDYGIVESVIVVEDVYQPMYNLTVDEAHTFFIGDGDWLVHNVCGTSREARRQAMRNANIPIDGTVAEAIYRGADGEIVASVYRIDSPDPDEVNRLMVVMRHEADEIHPNPHWEVGVAKLDNDGNVRFNSHGLPQYYNQDPVTGQPKIKVEYRENLMSENELKSKRRELARRRRLPQYRASVAKAIGKDADEITVLNLDQTEKIQADMSEKKVVIQRKRQFWFIRSVAASERSEMDSLISLVKDQVPNHIMYLIRSQTQVCGFIELDLHTILAHLYDLVEFEKEDVLASSKDGLFALQFTYENTKPAIESFTEVYTLELQGEYWLQMLSGNGLSLT